MGEPGHGLQLQCGVEEQSTEQVVLLGVEQLDVVDGVEPQDCLEGSAIIKTSFSLPLRSEAGSKHH